MALASILALSLKWEPDIHGLLVVVIAIVLLPGSIYLLLSTNLGGRVGFLLACAGLFGWLTVMAIVWTIYGIGYAGNPPAWKVQQTITGDVGTSSAQVLDGFPKGWHKLAADAPQAAEAVAAADPLLAPPAGSGRTGPFATSSDYLPIGAFDIGGQHYLPGWSHPPDIIAFKHKPHYFLLEVQRVLAQPTVPGQAPPKAKADPSKPVVSVLMIRDLGNLRQKPGFVAGYSFVLFAVCVYVLHRRDKQAMAARGSALEPVGRR